MRRLASLAAAAVVGVLAFGPAAHATPAPVPDRSKFNLTSMCRPSEDSAQLRIRNNSDSPQPYILTGPAGLAVAAPEGDAPVGDTLVTVGWSKPSDTWKLTIAGHEIVKAVGDNAACPPPSPSPTPTATVSPDPGPTATASPEPTTTGEPTQTASPDPTGEPTPSEPQVTPTADPTGSVDPVPSPTVEPSPADTVPAGNPSDLPRTGAPVLLLAALGGLAVSAGGIGVVLARRRRTTFTV